MSDIILTEKHGSIAILTLNRPDMMNALGQEGDGAAVAAACAEIEDDPAIRVAILTGAGRAFSAGGDVKAMRDRTGAFGGSPYNVHEGYRRNPPDRDQPLQFGGSADLCGQRRGCWAGL